MRAAAVWLILSSQEASGHHRDPACPFRSLCLQTQYVGKQPLPLFQILGQVGIFYDIKKVAKHISADSDHDRMLDSGRGLFWEHRPLQEGGGLSERAGGREYAG